MSEYKSLKYYHQDKNKKTYKNSFISFMNKIIQYDNTFNIPNLFHHYKANPLKKQNYLI